jgi:hypothetical protein
VSNDWRLNQNDKPTVFEANGYNEIKSFFANNKMRYLLFGSIKVCGACFVEFVTLVHFEDGTFILDFEYAVESRSYESKLFFDATNLSLSTFYDTNDLTPDCHCTDEQLEDRYKEDNNDIDIIKTFVVAAYSHIAWHTRTI